MTLDDMKLTLKSEEPEKVKIGYQHALVTDSFEKAEFATGLSQATKCSNRLDISCKVCQRRPGWKGGYDWKSNRAFHSGWPDGRLADMTGFLAPARPLMFSTRRYGQTTGLEAQMVERY